MRQARSDKLHLGCGHTTPDGWLNVDGSWSARLSRHRKLRWLVKNVRVAPAPQFEMDWSGNVMIHDVRRRLPFPDGSFTAIYASHLLEHLYLAEATQLLGDCRRVLKPGGVLRMVVPDLRAAVLEYTGQELRDDSVAGMAVPNADRLNLRLLFRTPEPPSGSMLYRTYTVWKDFHSHKWMYDAVSLVHHFAAAGLTDVEEMSFRHSRIDGIAAVEEASRVLNGAGICIEGIKP